MMRMIFMLAFFSAGWLLSAGRPSAAGPRPPVVIVSDPGWEVSGAQTTFGEYPLSAAQIPSATAPLSGGAQRAVVADYNPLSKIIPGSTPIWRNRQADGEGEAYQFRKTVSLGADPIRKATLEVNADDVARVYINKRLVSVDKRDGTLKDGYDRWFFFRSVSAFTYNRIYTYDVTDYFFTNVPNTVVAEVVSLAFDGSHAYFSAKITIEFDPLPAPVRAPAPARAARKPAPAPASTPATAMPVPAAPALPEKIVFEAGRDPEIAQLQVGSILELGQVQFKADDYRLDSSSYRTLYALVAFMKRHPGLKVEVGGHTNLLPGKRFALELSEKRARAVAQYLRDNGIAAERVRYKGYGKSRPRVQGVSPVANRENQRVELRVVGR